MTSPTSRTLQELRKLGFTAAVVEHFNAHVKRRVDLFGIGDVLAVRAGVGVLLIQATSRTNHAARRTKAIAEPRLRPWLESGARFEVWSWALMGERRKPKRWKCWREEVRLDDLPPMPPEEEEAEPAGLFATGGQAR